MKKPQPFLHMLFTLYAWTIGLVFVPIFFVFFFICVLFGYKRMYFPVRSFYLIFYLLWSPIRVRYHPEFDFGTPYVLIQNHVNVLDAFLAGRISPNPICGIMHAWQFNIPFYGWIMKLSLGIPVNPQRKDNIKNMVKHAQKRKEDGLSILAFPEGGRTLDGNMKPFKRGIFVMAQEVGYPIVPIAIRGNRQINQKGSYQFWPHPVDIYVGKPHTIDKNATKKDLETLMQKLHQEMSDFIHGRNTTEL